MSGSSGRPLLFCATGITETVGGIASANRNVLAALQDLGNSTGHAVARLVLNEPRRQSPGDRAFNGDQLAFAFAALGRIPATALVVFDHVRLALPVLALPRTLRPPVVICAHGSESWRRIRPASIRAFRAADLVLANSSYTLQRMQATFSRFNGVACPLGLAPQVPLQVEAPPWLADRLTLEAADGQSRELGERVLLIVGRVDAGEREKGHRELIAALPQVAERFPETQLVLVGGGSDLAELRALAAASPSASQIFLPGPAPGDLLEALYRKAFAFVMPSRQEGFGLAYLEAMNFAKPCLACHDDGGADVIVDGVTGVLIPREFSQTDLVGGVAQLLGNPVRARAYGEAGWRRLTVDFTSQAHQRRVERLLEPLVRT